MGGLLSEMWRRLQSAWRSWRRTPPQRDVVDAGIRQGELCLEKGVREVDTGAAQEKAEQGSEDGRGCRPVKTEPCGVEAPGDRAPSGEIAANDGELAEQESVEQEGAEREPAEEKPTEQEPLDRERAQGEIVAEEEDTAPPEVGSRPTRRRGRRKPVERGGARGGAQERPPPGDSGRSRTPVRVSRARIVCRQRAGRWEVAVVPAPGVVVRGETEGPSAAANGEFLPKAFRSVAQIEDEVGGQTERVPLYVDEPMVFRLGADWQGEGRKVGGVGVGHFIVIAPAEWTRLGDAPVDPEACVDAGFRAHYFVADRGDGQAVEGFAERGVSSSIIALDGDRVFDESEQGELFVGEPPALKAVGMAFVRVGEEGKQGWGESFALDGERSLADVLDGREGRFFVRVYREGTGMEADSVQFRYLGDLREIRMKGEAYAADTVLLPTTRGNAAVDVRIVAAERTGVAVTGATDGTREFEVDAGTVVCPADPEARQLRFRVAGTRGDVDVVVGLPRMWWRLATPGESPEPWRDQAQTMTREEFRTLGLAGAEIWVDVPERVPRVGVGFDDEGGMNYRARKDGPRRCCAVPLAHYLDHMEIDQRLFRDAALGARLGEAAVDLIGITADPLPRIVDFSVGCGRVSPGDSVVVQWRVEDCEGVTVSLEPGVGPVGAEGSREIRVEQTMVVTLTLSAAGMEDVVEERAIEVEEPEPASAGGPVAHAKALGGWRPAKGFSAGEVAAVRGAAGLPIRADWRRRSVHAINVATLERWMNGQR